MAAKCTDAELLQAWEDLKQAEYVTVADMVRSLGYRASMPKRLRKLIPEEEYRETLAQVEDRKYPRQQVEEWFNTWKSQKRTLREMQEVGAPSSQVLSRLFKKHFGVEFEDACEAKAGRGYIIGRQFEYRCRDYLRKRGYVVFRSPRSQSPADLVAMRSGTILLVQCKTRKDMFSSIERSGLTKMAQDAGGLALLAYRGRKYTGVIHWETMAGEPHEAS